MHIAQLFICQENIAKAKFRDRNRIYLVKISLISVTASLRENGPLTHILVKQAKERELETSVCSGGKAGLFC